MLYITHFKNKKFPVEKKIFRTFRFEREIQQILIRILSQTFKQINPNIQFQKFAFFKRLFFLKKIIFFAKFFKSSQKT